MAAPDPTSPPHGYALTAADRALLRSPPPPAALRWCAEAVGAGATVTALRALDGGLSSAVHAVDVRTRAGAAHALVLRRLVRPEWLAEEPGAAAHEAAALTVARACPLPTPELVGVDADGSAAGAPAVLMTRLPGAVSWRAADLDDFLRRLAEVLPAVHATAVPADAGLPPYAPYALRICEPPPWTTRPAAWRRALAAFDAPVPAGTRLVHRDYHPGNVLWRDGAVSGVVDWVAAAIGCPGVDVGHCRMNLAAALGRDAADSFEAHWRALTGAPPHDPYWDVVAALGGFDAADLERWSPRQEAFLLAAADRL